MKKKIIILFWAWLLPGAGYYYFRQKWKFFLLFTLLFLIYLSGMAMGDFRNVSFIREPAYFPIQIFIGFTLPALVITYHLHPIPLWNVQGYYTGCVYICIASLLNLLTILRVWELLNKEKN